MSNPPLPPSQPVYPQAQHNNYQSAAPVAQAPAPAQGAYTPVAYPGTAYPPPAAASPKKRWGFLKVFLVVTVLFVTLTGGCSAFFYLSTKAEVAQANELLAAWQAKDYEAVKAMVSPNCDAQGFDEITGFLGDAEITDYRLAGVTVAQGPQNYANGTMTINGVDERIVSIGVDDLGICSVRVGAQGQTSF